MKQPKKKKVLSKKIIRTPKPYTVKKIAAVKKSKPITAEKKGVPTKAKANSVGGKTNYTGTKSKMGVGGKARVKQSDTKDAARGKGVTKRTSAPKSSVTSVTKKRKYYRTGK